MVPIQLISKRYRCFELAIDEDLAKLITEGEKSRDDQQYELALEIFQKALSLSKKENIRPKIAKSLERIGDLTYILSKSRKALQESLNLYQQALDIFLELSPRTYAEDIVILRFKHIKTTKELKERRSKRKK